MNSINQKECQYMVHINCITYNHAPYIEDAMNGFSMQQTTFPFVATIIDDASTDGEPEIIKNYLNENFDMGHARTWETDDAYFIEAIHKSNQHCTFAVVLLKNNFYQIRKDKSPLIAEWAENVKYTAICEGDDYWTCSDKLQMQIDFLESHSDYGLTYTNIEVLVQKDGSRRKGWCKQSDFREMLLQDYICTLTTIIRKELLDNYYIEVAINPTWKMGDYPLWLYLMSKSKAYYFEIITGTYRLLEESASHSKDISKRIDFVKSAFDVRYYFAKKNHALDMCKKIAIHEIEVFVDMSLGSDVSIEFDGLSKFVKYKIVNPKLFFLYFATKFRLGRIFIRHYHRLANKLR